MYGHAMIMLFGCKVLKINPKYNYKIKFHIRMKYSSELNNRKKVVMSPIIRFITNSEKSGHEKY